ncbi:MAG: hypothetical protein LBR10_13150 [Prevotellaceae bacterium]|jgi:peptidoglycan/LPS O-acetylase OafA/YrhL|nr:hypothetical protein [Prevotellaceae bacterium]
MNEILGQIYCWFESLFSQNFAEYLWGYNCDTQQYDNPNMFNQVGLLSIVVSLICVLLYYYAINHPRFSRWWHWLIVLIASGAINLFIGYGWTISDFRNGVIGDCLMYVRNEQGDIVNQLIYETDCWMFGVTNFIVSSGFFIIFSFALRWGSSNCRYSPFVIRP